MSGFLRHHSITSSLKQPNLCHLDGLFRVHMYCDCSLYISNQDQRKIHSILTKTTTSTHAYHVRAIRAYTGLIWMLKSCLKRYTNTWMIVGHCLEVFLSIRWLCRMAVQDAVILRDWPQSPTAAQSTRRLHSSPGLKAPDTASLA